MADIGTGTSVAFDSGFFAEVLDISGPSSTRVAIGTSHLLTTIAMTFTPGDLVDWGEVTLEIAFDPKLRPPIDDTEEVMTITFANSAASVWAFTAFMTGFEPSIPLEERMTGSATVKITGDATVTP